MPKTQLPPYTEDELSAFYRILISINDFIQARIFAEIILNNNLHDEWHKNRLELMALNCAMIVAYGRPFSGNDQRTKPKIPDLPMSFLKDFSREERKFHDYVINLRNTVWCHSDSLAVDLEPVVIVLPEIEHKSLTPVTNPRHAPFTRDTTIQFKDLCTKLCEATLNERMRLEPIFIDYFRTVDPSKGESLF